MSAPQPLVRDGVRMGGGSSPVRSISAVTLATADMAGSFAFYTALGFAVRYGAPDAQFTSFRVGDGHLNVQLDPTSAPVPHIWGRVIFYVDDVDAMHTRAVAAGRPR